MDLLHIIEKQNREDGDFSPNSAHSASLVSVTHAVSRRQTTYGIYPATTVLPTGVIIGTAVAGSALLFLSLALIIRYRLRSRNKRKIKQRESLGDETEEDIIEALRSTRPPEVDLGYRKSLPTYRSTKELAPDKHDIDTKSIELQTTHPNLAPPSYGFQAMEFRDSWPLVGWRLNGGPHMALDAFALDHPSSNYPPPFLFQFPHPTEVAPTWPKRTVSRPMSASGIRDDRSTWSMHSANSSVTSLRRLSLSQRSISDNQLTSILRSTSQRLKEVQQNPRSRTMSVLSQVSGAPPELAPPSIRRDGRPESREGLIDLDDISCAESVRSSMLYPNSQTPSPVKDAPISKKSPRLTDIEQSFESETSEPDSIFPCPSPDVVAPVPLTSPSRRRPQTNQKLKSSKISAAESSAKIYEDYEAMNDDSATKPEENLMKRMANNDTLASASIAVKRGRQPLVLKAFEFGNKQKVSPGNNSTLAGSENIFTPLTPVSGNHQSPIKAKLPSPNTPSEEQVNPFQWSPQITGSFITTPSRSLGRERRRHRRIKTVRLSHLPRPVSVSVVLEESENDSPPTSTQLSTGRLKRESALTEMADLSTLHVLKQASPENRPPSIPDFHPSFNTPPSTIPSGSKRTSESSYSATLSFYDYYSSPEVACFNQTLVEPVSSPTPSARKGRRLGHNISVDISKNDHALQPLVNPPSSANGILKHYKEECFSVPRSAPAYTTNFDFPDFSTTSSVVIPRLHGPRPQPVPVPNRSVPESVSMLRRMNSEVSMYSSTSFHSKGSPTIPALRGGGLSPSTSRASGARKYLGIGMTTSSPRKSRRCLHDSVIVHQATTQNRPPLSTGNDNNETTLEIFMPVAGSSAPETPSLEMYVESSNSPLSRRKSNKGHLPDEKYQACNRPPPYLHFNSNLDGLVDQYHSDGDNSKPMKLVKENCNDPSPRWSEAMSPPLAQSVRHESQIQMPSPQGTLLLKRVDWRGSVELYDEMGFLKSSPNLSRENSPLRTRRMERVGTAKVIELDEAETGAAPI